MKRYSRDIWRVAGIVLYLYCCSDYMTLCICQGFTGDSDGKKFAHSAGHSGLIPGSGRSPGEGNGNALP